MKRFLFPSLLSLAVVPSFSQEPDWSLVHTTTLRGIDQLYNLSFAEAERTFDDVITTAPNDPRGHFFKSMVHYWTYILTQDKQAFDRFFTISEKVIEVSERILDRDKENGVAKYYLGGIYGFRGLAYQRNGSLLSAVWDGRKGYSYLKEAASQNVAIYDAQMGFGLFNYLVAKIPKSFRWVLNLLGFSGDLEGGLASLKLAADKGTYARNEASFFYAQFSYFEHHEDEAYSYLRRLMNKYPENTLFLITYAQWEFRNNNLAGAIEAARKAVDINTRRKIQFGDEFAHSVLATFSFAQNDFATALKNTELAIEKTENKENVSNNTYYRLGLCYELLGQRQKAVETYRLTRKADRSDRPWEYHYYRLSRKRIALPLDSVDVQLIKAANATTLKRYEDAASIYHSLLSRMTPNVDQRALALYGLSGAYSEQERFEDVVSTIKDLLTHSPQQEIWVVPHARLRLGIAYAKLGETANARREFEAIDEYDGYDFQERTESRAEEELKKLGDIN